MPSILAVNNDVPAKSFADFVALAKAQPGKLSYASPGVGTPQHIAGELLKSLAGIDIVHVPYRGTTQILPDLLGGRLNLFFGNISNVLPLVREGKLRAFGITSKKRSPQIPELPTMEELGFPGYEATAWFGMMGPAGLPKPIVDKIHDETVKLLAQPDVRGKLESLGLQLVGNTPAQFAAIVKQEMPMWGKVIKDAGIKAAQ
jgi:tripartite-type tricarboxylate transporter receptor subunit TctC